MVDFFIDGTQRGGVIGDSVDATGGFRQGLEGAFVNAAPHAEREVAEHGVEQRGRLAADADGVDLDAPLGGKLGGFLHAALADIVLTVGEQDDDLALDLVVDCFAGLPRECLFGGLQAGGGQSDGVANGGAVFAFLIHQADRG